MNVRSRLIGIAFVGGIAAAILVAGTSLADGPDDGRPGQKGDVELPAPADDAVSAEQLWRASVDATRCFEEEGLHVLGPYPAADGSIVHYSVEVTPDAEAIEATCTKDLGSLSARYQLDNPPTGGEEASRKPPSSEAEGLVAIRDELSSCLEAAGLDPDPAMAVGTDPFRACSTQVG